MNRRTRPTEHQGPREVQALRVVVCRNVLLHLWGLFRALSAWKIAGTDRWKDASRCRISRSFAGNVRDHGNAKPDAFSLTHPACRSESLDEYGVGRALQHHHDCGDSGWLALRPSFLSLSENSVYSA